MPFQPLHIEVTGVAAGQEVSLRGACRTPADARDLQQLISRNIFGGAKPLWIDCERLTYISYAGQQAVFRLEQQARAARVPIYWCKLSGLVGEQLAASGLYLLLRSLPGGGFCGAGFSSAASGGRVG